MEKILNPVDIAERRILEFLKVPKKYKAEVFSHLDPNFQEETIRKIGSSQVADILNSLSPDDRTQMLEDFPDELIKYSINLLNPSERSIALKLLGYKSDSIARLMTPRYRRWNCGAMKAKNAMY